MGSEKDKSVAVIWDMTREGFIACFADERNASQSSHVKAATPVSRKPAIDASVVMIELIDTDTAGEESVAWVATDG